MAPAKQPGNRLAPYFALVAFGVAPLILLGVLTHSWATTSAREQVVARNEIAATATRDLVEREFEHHVGLLTAFSRLPVLSAAAVTRDEAAARERLQLIVDTSPRVVRAFITDTKGNLWSDYPRAPESLGRNFADRDWFKGLADGWTPYVSSVYTRNADPKVRVVAVAVPIRQPGTTDVVAALVCQVGLAEITTLLQEMSHAPGASVFLVDHGGNLAAHPRVDLQERDYRDYAQTAVVTGARPDAVHSLEYEDPLAGDQVVATSIAIDVRGGKWVIVSQQPIDLAFAAASALGWRIALAGILVTLLVGALLAGISRVQMRVRRANERLADINIGLFSENKERRQQQEELQQDRSGLQKRVEEGSKALKQKEDELRHAQKMEAVGLLAGGVAHDFNNLLSVIIGYGEFLLLTTPKDGKHRKEIEQICQAGERASQLTRQLLAFSRKQVIQTQIIDVNESVMRMERMLSRLIGEDIDLVCSLSPDMPPVKCDPGQLEQVVLNLAVNARDAMPKGGKLTISTQLVMLDASYDERHNDAGSGPHVMIAVTDTGCGMTPEVKARIFEPFFTTKELGRGTGLGLPTVYGIVKQSGGRIWVYSEVGVGTTFKVYLPAVAEAPPAAPAPVEAAPSEPATGTILLAEDEPAVRNLLQEILAGAGYTVLAAGSGPEALQMARDHSGPIGLLLTDVIMPGMSGPQLAGEIAALRPATRVLFMSGYTDEAISRHGLLSDDAAFMEKPIRPQVLLQKVRDTMAGRPSGRHRVPTRRITRPA